MMPDRHAAKILHSVVQVGYLKGSRRAMQIKCTSELRERPAGQLSQDIEDVASIPEANTRS
jgi:hypothetical protein